MRLANKVLALACVTLLSTSCSAAYYGMMSKLGKEKRDILVSRVLDAKEDQVDAQEQFKTTFEALQDLTNYDGGELETAYKRFSSEYDDSVEAADDVSDRISKIEKVADDMFAEWEKEITEFESDKARRRSEGMLRDTRTEYDGLLRSMHAARGSMDPVLAKFKDQVLSLKHSLNASALSSLKDDAAEMQTEVDDLIGDMQKSIAEAEAFIQKIDNQS